MVKETYYFSHDSNALTDTKILNMRADYGLEGYGLYWVIIEMLRNEEDYKLELNKNTYRAIKTLSNTTIDIEQFIKDCMEDYKLFDKEDEKFYSNSLLRRMEYYKNKKAVNQANGKKGGAPKGNQNAKKQPKNNQETTENNPTVELNQPKTTKNNQNKVKENKIKENKINKNKIKENIVDIYNSICTNLPQVQKITEKREKAIDKFLKEFTLEQFEEMCKKANRSDFLIGKNKNGWKADFDFLMRTDKATNVLEGKYSDEKADKIDDFLKLYEEAIYEEERNNTGNSPFSG